MLFKGSLMEIGFESNPLLYTMYAQTHGLRTFSPIVRFADIPQPVEPLTPDRVRPFPNKPLSEEEIFNHLKEINPDVFSSEEVLNEELRLLLKNVLQSNSLHPHVYPEAIHCHRDILRWAATILEASNDVSGQVTTNHQQTCLEVLLGLRTYAEEKGNPHGDLYVTPDVDPAWLRAAQILEIDIFKEKEKINRNTIGLLTCNSLNINEICDLGLDFKIPVHLDLYREGINNEISFKMHGLTSVSLRCHNEGALMPGDCMYLSNDGSILKECIRANVVVGWPGGFYATPGLQGSSSGMISFWPWYRLQQEGQFPTNPIEQFDELGWQSLVPHLMELKKNYQELAQYTEKLKPLRSRKGLPPSPTTVYQSALKFISNLPLVQGIISREIDKKKNDIIHGALKEIGKVKPVTQLKNRTEEKIQIKFNEYFNVKEFRPEEGKISGTTYHNEQELLDIQSTILVHALQSKNISSFSEISRQCSNELIEWVGNLLHAPIGFGGIVTAGGSISILSVLATYKSCYRGEEPPQIVMPETAHAAFWKAARILRIEVVAIPVDADGYPNMIKFKQKASNPRTMLIVGSAPAYPLGDFDPIQEMAEFAYANKIPLHVDNCLGSLASMTAKGMPPFDFQLDGVSSITSDTHKFGYSPKGSSLAIFRDKEILKRFVFTTTQFGENGQLYAQPGLFGQEPGFGAILAWATQLALNLAGHIERTEKIIVCRNALEEAIRTECPDLRILGHADLNIVAFTSDTLNIYAIIDALKKRKYDVNSLQGSCKGGHFCITWLHAQSYENDLLYISEMVAIINEAITEVKNNPNAKSSTQSLYGSAAKMPQGAVLEGTTYHYSAMYKPFIDTNV